MSDGYLFALNLLCTIEQWTLLIGTIWLVGWKGWSPWWFLLSISLIQCASPRAVLKSLGK